MNILRSVLTVGVGLTALFWSDPPIRSQEIAPPRAASVAMQLQAETFDEVAPGITGVKVRSGDGVEVVALRIKASLFQFDLVAQETGFGEVVEGYGQRTGAIVAINGGFFSINKKGNKHPVGLFSKNQVHYSQPWRKSGGYLIFVNGEISIVPTFGNPVPDGDAVLQSKPTLIEPGGKWAMNTNQAIAKKRTLVCRDKSGDVVIVAIVGGGLSLFEAGWLMREPEMGGFFNCDSAIAMDGGGSTQIWVKGRPDLSYAGNTPVHNAVVIQPR